MIRALALSLLLLCAPAAHAVSLLGEMPLFPYEKQGGFVIGPARLFSAPVYQVGFLAAGLVCLPVSIAQGSLEDGKVDREKEASFVCGKAFGTAIGWPVYAAVGLPFFILKGAFWDAPRALFHKTPQKKETPLSGGFIPERTAEPD